MRPAQAEREGATRAYSRTSRRIAAGLVLALGLILAWQVVRQVFIVKAPPSLAVSLAPTSPLALRRSAEAALAAGQVEAAGRLARQALERAPFDVKALRVAGLVEAQQGDLDTADDLLTLAGNWSLRDGATHLWLTDRRLRQGQFGDAFAHADTLMRRRASVQPHIFSVLSDAGISDPRAFSALARMLITAPPWRPAYVAHLSQAPQRQPLGAALALAVATDPAGALTEAERALLYAGFAASQNYAALKRVSEALDPIEDTLVRDAGFSSSGPIGPLGWTLGTSPGLTSERLPAPDSEGFALHVVSDGYSSGVAAQQLLFLSPRIYRFEVRGSVQQGRLNGKVAWTLTCAPSGAVVLIAPLPEPSSRDGFSTRATVNIPAEGCSAQTLALQIAAGDRRRTLELWVENLNLRPG